MIERVWKTIEGQEVIIVDVLRDLLAFPNGKSVHIGTDSQQSGKHTEFVTVLVVLTEGKGGRAFYCRERVARIKNLRERLLKEVWSSVDFGLSITSEFPDGLELTVHIDANPDVRFKSSTYIKELTSLVVSQGFKTLLKPDSWAASHTADHVVKKEILHL
jgi:predicted RNase H-related nuclease YkuK (DUF458 family)